MRALLLAGAALAACSPDIASGAYTCGAEQACPPGQACTGSDATCVVASAALPFACDPTVLHEPDDTAAQAFALATLACVSPPVKIPGCLAAGDAANWASFQAPASCTAVQVQATLVAPIAFEGVGVTLWDLGAMTQVATDTACPASTPVSSGEIAKCLTQTLTPGGHYGLEVVPEGGGDCGGKCNYNRYSLTMQLSTP